MDADMSHDPNEIKVMVNLLSDYDVIIGSRYIDGVSVIHWPIRRLLLSYSANVYSRIVTGLPIKDSTGGFKAWQSKVLETIDFDSVKSQGYSFQIEMNWRAWQKGFSLNEHPIIFTDRTIGESKMSRGIMFEAMIVIWRMRIWKIFGWHK
jgi:dolichol-phosphate mannosyltransferase